MARTNIAEYEATGGGVEIGTWTSLSVADGAQFTAGVDGKRFLLIQAGSGKEVNATIKSGVGMNSGIGDLVLAKVSSGGTLVVGPLESERFEQADGKIYINFTAGDVGSCVVLVAPKG